MPRPQAWIIYSINFFSIYSFDWEGLLTFGFTFLRLVELQSKLIMAATTIEDEEEEEELR